MANRHPLAMGALMIALTRHMECLPVGIPDQILRVLLQHHERLKGETIALAHCYGEDAIEGVADLHGLDLPAPDKLRVTLLGAACNEAS